MRGIAAVLASAALTSGALASPLILDQGIVDAVNGDECAARSLYPLARPARLSVSSYAPPPAGRRRGPPR